MRVTEVLDLEVGGKMGVHFDGSRGVGVSRLGVLEGPSGRLRTKAERARIAGESMMPGVTVADVARKHGTPLWQIYDWRKQLREGNLVVPESVAALPVVVELVVDDSSAEAPSVRGASEVEIVVGDVVIRAGAGADEGQLRRHLADFIAAYNSARRLKTLNGLTPCDFVCKVWTTGPDRFIVNPIHQMPGLNT